MYYCWLKELLSNAVYAFGKGKDKECQEWKNKALELEKNLPAKTMKRGNSGRLCCAMALAYYTLSGGVIIPVMADAAATAGLQR